MKSRDLYLSRCVKNGYRVFSDVHIDQFRIARIAFQIEVLQSGMRKRIVEAVKLSAKGLYDDAITLTKAYIEIAQSEITNANEAVEITNTLLKSNFQEKATFLKRKEVSEALSITMDTLRNWEINGLLKIKRKENGYRIYDNEDIVSVCDRLIISLNAAKENAEKIIECPPCLQCKTFLAIFCNLPVLCKEMQLPHTVQRPRELWTSYR